MALFLFRKPLNQFFESMEPSFDHWTSLFLLAAGAGLFFALMVMLPPSNRRRNLPVALLLIAFAGLLFSYVMFWTGYVNVWRLTGTFSILLYLLGPLLWVYFKNLFGQRPSFLSLLHFLPFLLGILGICFVTLGRAYPDWSDQPVFRIGMGLTYLLFWWIQLIHLLGYAIGLWVFVGRKSTMMQGESAALMKRWSRILVGLFSLFCIVFGAYYLIFSFTPYNKTIDYSISLVMTASIYLIGYFAYREPGIFNGEIQTAFFLPEVKEIDGQEEHLMGVIFEKVEQYMQDAKPYVEPELRMVHLADQVELPAYLVSQAINQGASMNFNQYVNRFRVVEAERLLLSGNESVKEAMYGSGFNSKASFYAAFKSKNGCTPSVYRRQKKVHI